MAEHFLSSVAKQGVQSGRTDTYEVESVDLAQNILVLRASSKAQPSSLKLVYTSDCYEFTWQFNPDLTRRHNPRLETLPFPAGVIAEFVVVTVPTSLSDIGWETQSHLDAVLKLSGARVAKKIRLEVDDRTRRRVGARIRLPDGEETDLAFDIIGAWGDPDSEMVSVHLRPFPLLITQCWTRLRWDEPTHVQGHGYAGGTRVVFLEASRAAEGD